MKRVGLSNGHVIEYTDLDRVTLKWARLRGVRRDDGSGDDAVWIDRECVVWQSDDEANDLEPSL